MAQPEVTLRNTAFQDYNLNTLQSAVANAVLQLSVDDQPKVVVKTVTGNLTLTGDEDYVLVDMSGAIKDVYLLLPAPGALTRAITVKITAQGKTKLYVKASDTGSVKIDGAVQVQVTDSKKIIATATAFWTV